MNPYEEAVNRLIESFKTMSPDMKEKAKFGYGRAIHELDQMAAKSDPHIRKVAFCEDCEFMAQMRDGWYCTIHQTEVERDDYCSTGKEYGNDQTD